LVIACDNDRPKKPENLIAIDKMSDVLYDLYIMNAAKGVNRKLLEANGVIPETYILTKYNIDSLQFAESNMYYAFDNEDYEVIVDKVKIRLEEEKVEIEALQKTEKATKRKRDSIDKKKYKTNESIKKLSENRFRKVIDSTVMN
jgi:hypothetical protein